MTDRQKLQRQRARMTKRFLRSQNPRTRKPSTKKRDFVKAMEGTGGIKSAIARNLGVSRDTVARLLGREDWADVRQRYQQEVETGIDAAEECILYAINQRLDLNTATANARWLLAKVRKEAYGDESKVKIEGGEAIRVLHAHIPVESLNLPVEVKRQLVEAAFAKQEEQKLLEMQKQAQR